MHKKSKGYSHTVYKHRCWSCFLSLGGQHACSFIINSAFRLLLFLARPEPSQLQGIAATWRVPNYTSWWQSTHVNNESLHDNECLEVEPLESGLWAQRLHHSPPSHTNVVESPLTSVGCPSVCLSPVKFVKSFGTWQQAGAFCIVSNTIA